MFGKVGNFCFGPAVSSDGQERSWLAYGRSSAIGAVVTGVLSRYCHLKYASALSGLVTLGCNWYEKSRVKSAIEQSIVHAFMQGDVVSDRAMEKMLGNSDALKKLIVEKQGLDRVDGKGVDLFDKLLTSSVNGKNELLRLLVLSGGIEISGERILQLLKGNHVALVQEFLASRPKEDLKFSDEEVAEIWGFVGGNRGFANQLIKSDLNIDSLRKDRFCRTALFLKTKQYIAEGRTLGEICLMLDYGAARPGYDQEVKKTGLQKEMTKAEWVEFLTQYDSYSDVEIEAKLFGVKLFYYPKDFLEAIQSMKDDAKIKARFVQRKPIGDLIKGSDLDRAFQQQGARGKSFQEQGRLWRFWDPSLVDVDTEAGRFGKGSILTRTMGVVFPLLSLMGGGAAFAVGTPIGAGISLVAVVVFSGVYHSWAHDATTQRLRELAKEAFAVRFPAKCVVDFIAQDKYFFDEKKAKFINKGTILKLDNTGDSLWKRLLRGELDLESMKICSSIIFKNSSQKERCSYFFELLNGARQGIFGMKELVQFVLTPSQEKEWAGIKLFSLVNRDALDLFDFLSNPENTNLFDLLKEHGLDPNVKDSRGYTPLMLAVTRELDYNHIVALLKVGADPMAIVDVNGEEKTVLELLNASNRNSRLYEAVNEAIQAKIPAQEIEDFEIYTPPESSTADKEAAVNPENVQPGAGNPGTEVPVSAGEGTTVNLESTEATGT